VENLPTFDVRGIVFTDNPAPKLISQHLGIQIPHPPRRIDMTVNNIARIMWNNFPNANTLPYALHGLLGAYYFADNLYFNKAQRDDPIDTLRTDVHETMHSYSKDLNPSFQWAASFLDELYSQQLESTPSAKAIQSCLILLSYEEGICSWTDTEILARITRSDSTSTHLDRLHLSNRQHSNLSEIITSTSKSSAEAIRLTAAEAMNGFQEMFSPRLEEFNNVKYPLGHHFMFVAMNECLAHGMNVDTALNTLIINNPTTVEDIEDPALFVRNLLA